MKTKKEIEDRIIEIENGVEYILFQTLDKEDVQLILGLEDEELSVILNEYHKDLSYVKALKWTVGEEEK